jgi:hypothetical protein
LEGNNEGVQFISSLDFGDHSPNDDYDEGPHGPLYTVGAKPAFVEIVVVAIQLLIVVEILDCQRDRLFVQFAIFQFDVSVIYVVVLFGRPADQLKHDADQHYR